MALFIPLRGAGLHPAITYTRASDAWYRQADDANGERWAAAGGNDIARIHSWDGTAAHNGLLIEPARTNLIEDSADMTAGGWVDVGAPIVTANAQTAPDGTAAADTIEDDDGAVREARREAPLGTAGGSTYYSSVFSRPISGANPTGGLFQWDGAAWAVLQTNSGTTWSRVGGAWTDGGVEQYQLNPAANNNGDTASTGVSAFWGAQCELGSYPTSYIPTAGASATRAADSCTLTTARMVGVLSATHGRLHFVWVPGFDQDEEAGAVWMCWLDANTGLRYNGVADTFQVYAGGAEIAATAAQTFTANSDVFVIDWVWNGTYSQVSAVKNGTAQAGASGRWVAPTLGASIYLGSDNTPANHATGTYSDLMLGY